MNQKRIFENHDIKTVHYYLLISFMIFCCSCSDINAEDQKLIGEISSEFETKYEIAIQMNSIILSRKSLHKKFHI